MKHYEYRTISKDGQTKEGVATAKNEEALIEELRKNGLTVVNIKEVDEKKPVVETSKEISIGLDMGVSHKALTFFTRQLAITLNAGLPITRIISTLYNQSSNRSLKKVLTNMGADLQKGVSISDAMRKYPNVFDKMYLSMISVGETSGTLPGAVKRLAELLEKDAAIRRKIRQATAYPIFIIIFSLVLTYVLLAMVLPGFEPVFKATGLDIPREYPLTALLMQMSKIITNPIVITCCIAFLLILLIWVKFFAKSPRIRYLIDYIKFNMPFLSGLVRIGAVTRFSRSFAILTDSGVPLLQSLSLVADASGNAVVSKSVENITKDIQEGTRISETMKRTGIFPDLVIQMVNIGEEAGTVSEMLERTAEYFDSELEGTIDALTAVMEPAMMVLVGIIVGVFIMGILLPIMGIASRL